MALPPNPLEAKYEAGRSYLVAGSLLNAMVRLLRLQNIIPGKNLSETGTPNGRILDGAAGGGTVTAAAAPGALTLSLTRPPLYGAPDSGPAAGDVRIWVTFGTWNQRLPENLVWYLDVDEDLDAYIFAVATLATGTDRLQVAEWELLAGAAADTHETAAWGSGGELPATIALLLGTYSEATGQVASTGEGSIYTRDHLSNVTTDSGATLFTRNIDIVRH
jgi:hypothetical protein